MAAALVCLRWRPTSNPPVKKLLLHFLQNCQQRLYLRLLRLQVKGGEALGDGLQRTAVVEDVPPEGVCLRSKDLVEVDQRKAEVGEGRPGDVKAVLENKERDLVQKAANN